MIYISIGSNLGHRIANIQHALIELIKNNFNIVTQSPIIETLAILPPHSLAEWNKPFLNMVIGGTTQHSLENLLLILQNIEIKLGRENPHPKWSPRIIDLDILLSDQEVYHTNNLIIPHSELLN